jgi:hypothetical protein
LDHIGVDFDSKLVHVGLLLVEIARLYFLQTQAQGWTSSSIHRAQRLFSEWKRAWVEHKGWTSSILEHAIGAGHLVEDVIRHGPQEVYWVYKFEREISRYMRAASSSNHYLCEVSFTLYFSRTLFAHVIHQIQEDRDKLYPDERALLQIHVHLKQATTACFPLEHSPSCPAWHKKCLVRVSSALLASQLWKHQLKNLPKTSACREMIVVKGIAIGKSKIEK